MSSSELMVIWSPPLLELRHGDIQGFNIGYRSTNMATYNFTSVTGDGEDGGELLLGGLSKYTRYSVVVQAFNEIGPGPLSEPVFTQTLEDVPTKPPEDVRCAALSSQSLQISWQPPPTEHCNGLLQGYKLIYEPVLDDKWQDNDEMETRKTTALTIVITGLQKFTNYTLQVLGFTKVGDGVFSEPILCQTDEDVPGPPADLKVVVSSAQSLKVSWLLPLEPNGVIIKYNLYKRSMDGRQEVEHTKQIVSSQHTTFEAKGMQSHIEYQFWVSACTRVGEGQSSKVVSQVATSRVPARITSFGGMVVKPWRSAISLTCDAVGSPRREWLRGDEIIKGSSENRQVAESGELIISNLQVTDSQNYTCQVDNGQGSDRILYYLIVQVPPAAPLLYVTSATSTSILLHWKSGKNGGAPISGFVLTYRKEHGNLDEIQLSRHTTSYELKGLSCGSSFHLYLTARNKIGSSPPSSPLQARTQGHPPGVPPSTGFITPNSTSVTIRLHVWPDNGCPILYFVLQYRKLSESKWTLVSNALKPQRRTFITGLTPSTQYIVKLEAHNIAGFSSEEFTFMTLTESGEIPPPDLIMQSSNNTFAYSNIKIIIPVIFGIITVTIFSTVGIICLKHRRNALAKERLENRQNAEAQRERYYATIHKVALQSGEKIPETSEDISPYATFQLSEPSTLPQNTMLHSFMYHEHPMTEGCASPPPARSVQRNSPYYNIQKFQRSKGRKRTSRKTDLDSEESESDQEQQTSSRTESSNQLEMKQITKHNKYLIYHGPHSSTSSDISPMSEQKSLPRRSRSRWLAQGKNSTQRQTFSQLSVAETAFTEQRPHAGQSTPDRPELSEAECDIDTLKKLKLGLRSSLWSRPGSSGQPSDYSIAV